MPNRERALELYRNIAPRYDHGGALPPFPELRRRAVDHLELKSGQSVIDAGCGTGLVLPLLEDAVRPKGRIIAIDQSPEMLERARILVKERGWENVTFVESPVEEADIPGEVDAALFALSHDIMRLPKAVENVVSHVKPEGRISVVGMTWNPWWALPFNIVHAWRLRRGATTYEGLGKPWTHLEKLVPLRVNRVFRGFKGGYYFAWGVRPVS